MTKKFLLPVLIFLFSQHALAQVVSNASLQQSLPRTSSMVYFNLSDPGVETPIEWGLDLQWINESNMLRGIRFAGQDCIDIVRCGFMPSASEGGGPLATYNLQGQRVGAEASGVVIQDGKKILKNNKYSK